MFGYHYITEYDSEIAYKNSNMNKFISKKCNEHAINKKQYNMSNINTQTKSNYNKSSTFNYNLIAKKNSILLSFNFFTILEALKLKKFINYNSSIENMFNVLKNYSLIKKTNSIFNNISEKVILKLSSVMIKERYLEDNIIVKVGTHFKDNKFCIIESGRLVVKKEGKIIRELKENEVFGHVSLLLSINVTATIESVSKECVLYTINSDNFLSILDDNAKSIIIKSIYLYDLSYNMDIFNFYHVKTIKQFKVTDNPNEIENNNNIINCNRIHSSSIYIVHNNNNFYIAKVIYKNYIDNFASEKIKYIINNRNFVISLNHPFIIKYAKYIKHEGFIISIMELVNGNCLNKIIKESAIFNNKFINKNQQNVFDNYIVNTQRKYSNLNYNKTEDLKILNKHNNNNNNNTYYSILDTIEISNKIFKFYLTNLFSIVEYLQTNNICHRYLKPDCFIIDDKGFLKLINFETCIYINSYNTNLINKSNSNYKLYNNTIFEDPHYIQPEVLLGKGHNYYSDLWNIGLILYEIYYSRLPFGSNISDPMIVYKEILNSDEILKNNMNISIELLNSNGINFKDTDNITNKNNNFNLDNVTYDIKVIINKLLINQPNKRYSYKQFFEEGLSLNITIVNLKIYDNIYILFY